MAIQTDTTPPTTDNRETFTDVMVELGTGIKTLISHLGKAFDAGFEFPMKEGADVMDAIMAAQWVARRLSEDISMVGREFDGTRSE